MSKKLVFIVIAVILCVISLCYVAHDWFTKTKLIAEIVSPDGRTVVKYYEYTNVPRFVWNSGPMPGEIVLEKIDGGLIRREVFSSIGTVFDAEWREEGVIIWHSEIDVWDLPED